MNGNKNGLGFYVLKIFIYVLGIFQAAVYTPVVLSMVLFIVIISMFFQNGFINPLFRFIPSGSYDTADILAIYGKYAFGLSLVIAFAEIVFRKRFTIGIKKKILWLGILLFIGYCFVLIFLITKGKLGLGDTLIVLIPFFIFTMMAVFLSGLISALINWLNRVSSNSQSTNRF